MANQVYEVRVVRFSERAETFRVAANSQKEAQKIAEDEAKCYLWPEADCVYYEAGYVKEIND